MDILPIHKSGNITDEHVNEQTIKRINTKTCVQ